MKWIVFLLVIGMVLISGCSIIIKNCKTDATCFKENLIKCEPVKYKVEGNIVKKYVIEGLMEEGCAVKTEILSAPEDNVLKKGMSMECVYPNLKSILVEFSANEIAPDSKMCKGVLVDSLKAK